MINFTVGNITAQAETLSAAKFAVFLAHLAGPEDFESKRAWALSQVDNWAEAQLLALGVFTPYLFYILKVANIALLLLDWKTQGEPENVDPVVFAVIHSEAAAYRDAHAGRGDVFENMSPADLLRVQQERRNQMQHALVPIDYGRRLALEKIALAGSVEQIAAALAGLPG